MKISILIFDLSNNCLVRTYPIAKVLERHYDLEFIGPSVKGGVFKPYENEFRYNIVEGGFNYPGVYKTLKKIRDAITGDVVYAFKPKTTSLIPGLMKKKRDRTPLVLDIEDWEYAISSQNPLKSAASFGALWHHNSLTYLALLEKLAKKADERIVATRFLEKKFNGVYVPHGADTTFFDPGRWGGGNVCKEYGIGDETIVMFTGTPNPYKGVSELVSAVEAVNKGGGRMKLMIIGGDKNSEYVKKLMQSKDVIVTGFQPHSMMPEFLAAADVVALPQKSSRITEAQIPGKIFEAMAMAKPIIASGVSDLPEILEGCGVIVAPDDVEGLSNALTQLDGDRKRAKELGRKAREKCIRKYSWDSMDKRLTEVFERVMRMGNK